ncbi:helix-turn-helix transcriptional regulator [Lelliottia sp. SL45]|uniref:helix-turn-helix domain-containing protein n=1 Tax=Lelliottia sp. SL45 TaxID=2994665 RepID=UPI002273407C|nr:helix-turn-helix transcriptional regulator [Lelliottia sp. SL45]MCY1697177.1 helix-turn-helix transcriptional regulator [Lelliottia sp. SL45]
MSTTNEGHRTDWHPRKIVFEVHERGKTLRSISLAAGLAKDTAKNALYREWPKGQRIIADALGVAPEVIWPSRYNKEGV